MFEQSPTISGERRKRLLTRPLSMRLHAFSRLCGSQPRLVDRTPACSGVLGYLGGVSGIFRPSDFPQRRNSLSNDTHTKLEESKRRSLTTRTHRTEGEEKGFSQLTPCRSVQVFPALGPVSSSQDHKSEPVCGAAGTRQGGL